MRKLDQATKSSYWLRQCDHGLLYNDGVVEGHFLPIVNRVVKTIFGELQVVGNCQRNASHAFCVNSMMFYVILGINVDAPPELKSVKHFYYIQV